MNIIICDVYSRAAFISLDVALWGGVYLRVALNRVNAVYKAMRNKGIICWGDQVQSHLLPSSYSTAFSFSSSSSSSFSSSSFSFLLFLQIATALPRLSMKVLGPNTLVQTALPDILRNVPQEYYQKNLELYHSNATICCEELKAAPGLNPIMPKATMYIMVGALSPSLSSLSSPSLPPSFSLSLQ